MLQRSCCLPLLRSAKRLARSSRRVKEGRPTWKEPWILYRKTDRGFWSWSSIEGSWLPAEQLGQWQSRWAERWRDSRRNIQARRGGTTRINGEWSSARSTQVRGRSWGCQWLSWERRCMLFVNSRVQKSRLYGSGCWRVRGWDPRWRMPSRYLAASPGKPKSSYSYSII